MQQITSRLLSNKHTTGAAIAYVVIEAIPQIGAIWMPHFKEQFESTARILRDAALGYGLLMAGDSSKQPTTPNTNENKTP